MRSFALEFAHADLRYHDLPGDGVPILFVHGLGCASSCDYPRVAHDPVLVGRRMLLLDLLGSGFSDRPRDFDYTVESHARSVAALIEGLGFEAIDIYAHSAGGAVAIAATTFCPRVHRLVLSEPNLDPGGGFFSRQIAEQAEEAFVGAGYEEIVRLNQRDGNSIWAGSLAVTSPTAVHRLARSLVKGSEPGWRAQLLAMSIPRTVLFGEYSLPDPDVENLPRAGISTRIVPRAGHSLAWENPSALAAAIRDSLAE